jgi:hypothetical protein
LKEPKVPERPLLILPRFERVAQPRGHGGGAGLIRPTPQRQEQRLSPKFEKLAELLENPDQLLLLKADPSSIAPERAIVFEIAGQFKDFYEKAGAIGLEYLLDEEQIYSPDEDFQHQEKAQKNIVGRIYLAMPNLNALEQLLSLWKRYIAGNDMDHGFTMWRDLFSLLKDVRSWGPQDRVPPETIAYWRQELESNPNAPVRFEAELWFREQPERQQQAFMMLVQEIEALGGQIIDHAVIPSIRYDAALVDLPATQIEALINNPTVSLARIDEIMFFQPQSTTSFPACSLEVEDDEVIPAKPVLKDSPIAALFDGVPVQNHARLENRLIIDDPENLEDLSLVKTRKHATNMASLILYGDLNRNESPLNRPLYIRPIMCSSESEQEERPLGNRLLIDRIYKAVIRMKEGDNEGPATAPDVFLVNLSIGDTYRPFAGPMSPWARLLDHLSYKYKILFLVSAGNILDGLKIDDYSTTTDFEDADPEEREQAILKALNTNKAFRTLLSPAESLNALTVGAWHQDSCQGNAPPALNIDPYVSGGLPNISSALGLGHRKTIKPDILLDGGRELVRPRTSDGVLKIVPALPGSSFGLKAAAPDDTGNLQKVTNVSGTSAATALATRAAHQIFDVLMDQEGGSLHNDIPPNYRAVILKTMLVHGASWGNKGILLDKLFGPTGPGSHNERRDNIARLLGYGYFNLDHMIECSERRATLIGYGDVRFGNANLYRFPLPISLNGKREERKLTITLGWLSPINPRHQDYRMAALELERNDKKYSLGVKRLPTQPTNFAAERGTVLHVKCIGEEATVFVDDGELRLKVFCRHPAGMITEAISYGLAVTIEVGENSKVQVYDEIREQLKPLVPVPGK